jgi:hypothetical protein
MSGGASAKTAAFLKPEEAAALLRSPSLGPGFIRSLAAHPTFGRLERVRAAVVLHPNTPRPLALSLLHQLRWRDLQQVASTPGIAAPLALAAERVLLLRLPEMALGEKVALARSATLAVIKALRTTPSPLVVRALMTNARFDGDDALFLAQQADTPAAALQALAESPRFQGREELCHAIAVHPGSPPQTALRIVARLGPKALRRIAVAETAPALVRLAAERRLEHPGADA